MLNKIYHFYLGIIRKRNTKLIPVRIQKAFKNKDKITFLQIGSNDGKSGNDPIRKFILEDKRWTGAFVEPLDKYFLALKQNYSIATDRVKFIKKAVSKEKGILDFYTIDAKAKTDLNLPDWYSQISSFDINHIYKHFDEKIKPYIKVEKIESVPLSEIINEAGNQIDILHIDAEGYDWKILSQLDLNIVKPQIIIFEYRHLKREEIKEAKAVFGKHYNIHDCGCDFFCQNLCSALPNPVSRSDPVK